MEYLVALGVLFIILNVVMAEKILFISPIGTKSHNSFFGEMAFALADRGHQITYVTSYPLRSHPNITTLDVGITSDSIIGNAFESHSLSFVFEMMTKMPKTCCDALGHEGVQALNFEEYSLAFLSLIGHDCFYSALERAKIPIVYQSPNTLSMAGSVIAGNIDFPSVVPTHVVPFTHPMTFLQRTVNTVVTLAFYAMIYGYLHPSHERECKARGLCHENWSLLESVYKSHIVFINSVKNLERPLRPHVPGVIHAGGLNCRPAKPLPQDLDAWLRGAGEEGVIYFSLGSAVKPSDMQEKHRKMFVKVFGSLPQRVLWKWDQEQMQDLPSNVRIGKWLEQQDVLGHPSVRLFISHGGLFSTWETTYHAVPALFLPVFGDQFTNAAQMVHIGVGESLKWDDLTEENFKSTLLKLLKDPRYKETVTEQSAVMRDQPLSPKETVIYWTEYVIRHKGAPHLRSPFKDITWYQIYNVDVWLFLLGIAAGSFLLSAKLLLWCCRSRRPATHSENKKNK